MCGERPQIPRSARERPARAPSAAIGRLLFVLALVAAPNALATTLTRGPYLQLLTTRSVTVVWDTDIAANCSLRIGPVGGTPVVLPGPGITKACVVVVDGLTPGEAYAYAPFANGVALRGDSVFRADDPAAPFRVGIVGDTGTGSSGQLKVRDRLLAAGLDLVVHTGDMIYPDGALNDQNPLFFAPYKDLLRQMVFWPLLGNHDVETQSGAPWRQVFYTRPRSEATQSENYYSFDHGNAHFVVLDSNASTSPGSVQYTFLDEDLATSTATWNFVFFHHTIYATQGASSKIRDNLVPLFDHHGVDIVFMGHVHNYSRTKPLQDGRVVPPGTGTVYVTTGGGGASLASASSSSSTLAYAESTYHHTQVTIDGGSLLLEMIRSDGRVRDRMELTKGPATTTATTPATTTTTTLPGGATASVEVRVAASADDAEERATGSVSLTSSDLELVHDSDDQTVGLRFPGVNIPAGATIVRAYVQFAADEAQTEPTSLTIHGQAADDAPPFTTATGNVSSRPRTAAATAWASVPGWPTVGEVAANQRTPELASVIQEVVGRAGWAGGHALVLIVNGSGHRTAWAFDEGAAGAPLLHVDYRVGAPGSTTTTTRPPTATSTTTTTLPPGATTEVDVRVVASDDDAEERATGSVTLTSSDLELIHDSDDQTVGLRFAGVDIPPNATILSAYLQFTADEAQTEPTSLVIHGQAADDAPPFTTATGNISGRPRTAAVMAWASVPGWPTIGEMAANQRTPDLAPVIQDVVNRAGWARGNALVLIVTGAGHRTAQAFDEGAAGAPLLHVDYR